MIYHLSLSYPSLSLSLSLSLYLDTIKITVIPLGLRLERQKDRISVKENFFLKMLFNLFIRVTAFKFILRDLKIKFLKTYFILN